MRILSSSLLTLTAFAGLAGCPDRTISEVNPEQKQVENKDIPININRDIDILFLIDKSPTMEDEQASLTANFSRFIEVLEGLEGGLPNLRLAVISQDLGAGGRELAASFCTGNGDDGKLLTQPRVPNCIPPSASFIEDVEVEGQPGVRKRNYDTNQGLAGTFECIAKLGPVGCGFEQHLGSLQRALVNPPDGNKGFLRPDAFLAIIIISDEDDCTAHNPLIFDPNDNPQIGPLADFRCFEWGWVCDEGTMKREPGQYTNCRPRPNSPFLANPDDFVASIKALKPNNPKNIIVSTIIGPSAQTPMNGVDSPAPVTGVGLNSMGNAEVLPSCSLPNGQNASPMPRLWQFAQQFPDRNSFFSLCNQDLREGLSLIAQLIRRVIGNPCFESNVGTIDIDPNNPGLQLECAVSDVTNPEDEPPARIETPIPPCKMQNPTTPANDAAQPCWYVKPDPDKCEAYPTKLVFATHPEDRVTPANTHVIVQCVADPEATAP